VMAINDARGRAQLRGSMLPISQMACL
jgi:hypothetical protein